MLMLHKCQEMKHHYFIFLVVYALSFHGKPDVFIKCQKNEASLFTFFVVVCGLSFHGEPDVFIIAFSYYLQVVRIILSQTIGKSYPSVSQLMLAHWGFFESTLQR